MERIIVVPLRKARRGTKEKFASKAMRYLKNFVSRHMKSGSVIIGSKLNEFVWQRGMRNPPRRVEVKATLKDDVAFAELSSVSNSDWHSFLNRGKEEAKTKKAPKKEKKEEHKDKKPAKKPTAKKKSKTVKKEKPEKKKEVKKSAKKKETKKPVKKKAKKPAKTKADKKPAKKPTAKKKSSKPAKKKAKK